MNEMFKVIISYTVMLEASMVYIKLDLKTKQQHKKKKSNKTDSNLQERLDVLD